MVLLVRFCVCLCCAGIVPGLQLICRVLCFFFTFCFAKSLALICCYWFMRKISGVAFLSFGCVLCCCWFAFAFACDVWLLFRVSVHVLWFYFLFSAFFRQNKPEHDVTGNFPATRATNHECLRPLVPALPRSVSIVHQCTHTHPSAPICTHLHSLICLFINVPIRTHLHPSEYRYLFEKSEKIE